ncbi:MAG TPA: ABC transporter permease [Thermoanaerobaculia bacterium]|nr:ABC transporter permease [Thermoanaerobaculia bacterium]
MTSFFLRALSAETLKLRRTLALRMCLVTPAVVVALVVLQLALTDAKIDKGDPATTWKAFAGGAFALWAFLMMPLFVTLEASLLAGLEHSDRQWKHLLALPVPRSAHYLAKWAALTGLLLGTALVFVGLIAAGGRVLILVRADSGLAGWPDWWLLLRLCTGMVVAALFMAAIQLWVAIRWSSFTIAVAAGMSATVIGFIVGQSRFGHFYPWSMPAQLFLWQGKNTAFTLAVSALGAATVLAFSLWEFSRRELD